MDLLPGSLRGGWRVVALLCAKATMTLAVGLTMLVAHPSAFASPTWEEAFRTLPRHAWGVIFCMVAMWVLASLAAGQRRFRMLILAMFAEGGVYTYFALSFLFFAARHGGLGLVGTWTWLEIALGHLFISLGLSVYA